jgi:hypothetical protein
MRTPIWEFTEQNGSWISITSNLKSVTYHVIKDFISARVSQLVLHSDIFTFIRALAD